MQNVLGEGDFEHYQGVWRMQSLPNCAPNGGNASRLTYAVEIKPKGILPVRLIEGRIASDLKANMAAIRNYVEAEELKKVRRVFPKDLPSELPAVMLESAQTNTRTVYETASPESSNEVHPIQSEIIVLDRQRGWKRRSVLGVLSRLLFFRRNIEVTDQYGYPTESLSPTVPTPTPATALSETTIRHGSHSDKPSEVNDLLEENTRLKEKVASLEGEMRKANAVLRKIEILSKIDN